MDRYSHYEVLTQESHELQLAQCVLLHCRDDGSVERTEPVGIPITEFCMSADEFGKN